MWSECVLLASDQILEIQLEVQKVERKKVLKWAQTLSYSSPVHPKADFPWRAAGGLQSWFHERPKDQRHPHSYEEWRAGCGGHFPQSHSRQH